MLCIRLALFFVAVANLEVTVESDTELQYYDANKQEDLNTIRRWYDTMMDVEKVIKDEKSASYHLKQEACPPKGKGSKNMCDLFTISEKKCTNKQLPTGVWPAECIAVNMYTNNFFREYNQASLEKRWEPYIKYTYLLHSAIKKLSKNKDFSITGPVYRGLKIKAQPPSKGKKLFWKTFTSTSLSLEWAEHFGNETVLVFRKPGSKLGSRLGNLSYMPQQEEVLLTPFEKFDFEQKEAKNKLVFKTSDSQPLINSNKRNELK